MKVVLRTEDQVEQMLSKSKKLRDVVACNVQECFCVPGPIRKNVDQRKRQRTIPPLLLALMLLECYYILLFSSKRVC